MIGDKFGYKTAFILAIVASSFGTFFSYIPRYHHYVRSPSAELALQDNEGNFVLTSLQFSPRNCKDNEINILRDCSTSTDSDRLAKLLKNCRNLTSGSQVVVESLMVPSDPIHVNVTSEPNNGTFCNAFFVYDRVADTTCSVTDSDDFKTCTRDVGSHTVTFLTYLALRVFFQVGINAGYSIMDSSALECANRHNSAYNRIFLVKSVTEAIAPTLGGFLVRDSTDPNGSTRRNKVTFDPS